MKTYDQLSKQTRNSLEELYPGADVNLIKTALNMQKGVLEELKEYYGTEDINEIASKASRGVKPLPPTPKAEPAPTPKAEPKVTPPAKFKVGDAISHTTASGVVRFGKVLNVIALPNGKGWRYYCAATDGYQNFLAEEKSMTLSDAEPTPKEEPTPQPKVEPTPEPTPAPTPKAEPREKPKTPEEALERITKFLCKMIELKDNYDEDVVLLFKNTRQNAYYAYGKDAQRVSNAMECAPLKKQMGVWYTGFETDVTGWERTLQDAGITFDIIEGILP